MQPSDDVSHRFRASEATEQLKVPDLVESHFRRLQMNPVPSAIFFEAHVEWLVNVEKEMD